MKVPARESYFEEIYTQHLAIIWKTVHAFAVSREDKDDLFQEIMISLWEALPRFAARAKQANDPRDAPVVQLDRARAF